MEPINPFEIEDGGKTAGMMSYFFILGWSLAYFGYHQNNKTSLSSYQLRQTLLLFTTYLATFGYQQVYSPYSMLPDLSTYRSWYFGSSAL